MQNRLEDIHLVADIVEVHHTLPVVDILDLVVVVVDYTDLLAAAVAVVHSLLVVVVHSLLVVAGHNLPVVVDRILPAVVRSHFVAVGHSLRIGEVVHLPDSFSSHP